MIVPRVPIVATVLPVSGSGAGELKYLCSASVHRAPRMTKAQKRFRSIFLVRLTGPSGVRRDRGRRVNLIRIAANVRAHSCRANDARNENRMGHRHRVQHACYARLSLLESQA